MNLQERLLQNEIKHLGQIIQTLSYELVILQDFMKEEHGSKFEEFRVKYSSSAAATGELPRSSSSKKAQSSSSSANKDAEKEDDDENMDNVVVENDTDSDSDALATLTDPLESNEEHKGGRKRTKVWKYFDKITQKNNKFSARCHNCRSLVSSRASRMVEHLLKCKRNVREKKDYVKEVTKVVKMRDEEFEPFEQDGNNDSKSAKRSGRSMDTIWNYFEVAYHNNLKKAKCVSCGQFISPKAIRLRHHKMNCKGVEESVESREMTSVNDSEMAEFSEEEEGFSSSSSDVEKSSNENKTNKKPSKSKDTIWEYFQVVRYNDLKKAKCVSCGQFVSPKAVRMRQHKTGCTGIQTVYVDGDPQTI